eukprot:1369026-Amorphochlora_amoeboformis.AAC.2
MSKHRRATESDLEGVGSSGQPFQGSSRRPFTSPSAILAELALVLALASPQASASVGIPEMPRTSVGVVQQVNTGLALDVTQTFQPRAKFNLNLTITLP